MPMPVSAKLTVTCPSPASTARTVRVPPLGIAFSAFFARFQNSCFMRFTSKSKRIEAGRERVSTRWCGRISSLFSSRLNVSRSTSTRSAVSG